MTALKKARHFLRLLLDENTPPKQISVLLSTAGAAQTRALVEIIHNAIYNSALPLSPKLRGRILRQKRFKNLGKKSWKASRTVIKLSEPLVLTLLHAVRHVLTDLLKR